MDEIAESCDTLGLDPNQRGIKARHCCQATLACRNKKIFRIIFAYPRHSSHRNVERRKMDEEPSVALRFHQHHPKPIRTTAVGEEYKGYTVNGK